MGLRTRVLVGLVAVALFGVGASLIAAERYLAERAQEDLADDLERAGKVYEALDFERMVRRSAEARVIAEEPRLKAVVRTTDVDRATLDDVADEMRQASRADVFAFTDRMGVVTADASLTRLGDDLSERGELRTAMAEGEAVGFWSLNGALHEVVVRTLRFGDQVTGTLVTGHLLDARAAQAARVRTGSDVAVLLDGQVVSTALSVSDEPEIRAALQKAPEGLSEVSLAGARYVTLRMPYPGAKGVRAELLLARSLDEALARHRSVRGTLGMIGGASLLLAMGAGLVISRGMTRRIERLADATQALARGDLTIRVPEEGTDEVARLSTAFNSMTGELASSREALVDRERLQKEMDIAQRIQTSLLPKVDALPGYAFSAMMRPASSVGGDFYDVQQGLDRGLMIAVGDVTSHGLTPGLIMMMAQSSLSTLAAHTPALGPKALVTQLNRVLYQNVRTRLGSDDYMTLVVMREEGPGRFRFAGAHLPMLVRRANQTIEAVDTPGTWVGLLPEIESRLEENILELAVGDVLVVYTDGVTEARSRSGEMFDMGGLTAALQSAPAGAEAVRRHLIEALDAHLAGHPQDDDVTLVVLERTV